MLHSVSDKLSVSVSVAVIEATNERLGLDVAAAHSHGPDVIKNVPLLD